MKYEIIYFINWCYAILLTLLLALLLALKSCQPNAVNVNRNVNVLEL